MSAPAGNFLPVRGRPPLRSRVCVRGDGPNAVRFTLASDICDLMRLKPRDGLAVEFGKPGFLKFRRADKSDNNTLTTRPNGRQIAFTVNAEAIAAVIPTEQIVLKHHWSDGALVVDLAPIRLIHKPMELH